MSSSSCSLLACCMSCSSCSAGCDGLTAGTAPGKCFSLSFANTQRSVGFSPLRPKPASSLVPSSSLHNVHFSSQRSGFGAAGPNKRQGIAREVGKMKRKGKHLLCSQPALLPGRWLAQSRQASCCWPRWLMCWEPALQNEGGGERKESTKPSSSSAGGSVAKSSLFHIPLMYFPPSPPSSPLSP